MLDMGMYFFDINGDTLTYSVKFDNTGVVRTAKATDTGVEIALQPDASYNENALVTVRATDPEGLGPSNRSMLAAIASRLPELL